MMKSKVSQKKVPIIFLGVSLVFIFLLAAMMFNLDIVNADSTTTNHALRIVQQYKGVFTAPPTITNSDHTTDAPLLGNGDVGVAVLNKIDTMTFILNKNEFWSLNDKAVRTMAKMSLAIPSMVGASYYMTQDLATAEVNGTFTLSGNTITTKSWVQADDTSNNRFMTKFTYNGSGTKTVTVSLTPGNGNGGYGSSLGSSGDVLYIDARADSADTVGGYNTHRARVATRVIGTTGTISNNQLSFTLSSGGTYTLITSIMSNYDNGSYQSLAISNINSKTQGDVDNYLNAHHNWWNNFYSKSFVEIPNKTLEKEYYGSLYLLACTSRTGEAAPGLFGNWATGNPAWNGDYTLNYNYQTPFYMAFPTNHTELADCYDKPVIDWLSKAQAEATANGWTGAFYRVHIGPLPNGSGDTNTWNQKSCGAYAASDMLMHYYYTRDTAYANGIYNTLKQIAIFWQNYLSWDGSRYVIYNDAQHEGDGNPQTNGIMSLGLVRFLLQGVIDISTDLNVDSSQRATWQDRLSKLSVFPTFTRNGQTVFRYTEVGRDWNDGNAIGNQHIYPASQIGLGSDSNTLQIAKNMIAQMGRWYDDNGTNTFYPAAARVGHDPNAILNNLNSWVSGHTYPNLHIHTGGGGIENLNTVPATICEMLMQSFQNKIRLFADWPSGTNAKFGDLLAYGNFLVSSDIRSNVVQYIRIISNKGRSCTFINPWPGQTLRIYRNGTDSGTLTGSEITIATSTGETIHIAPNGTSYSTILSRMDVTLSGGSPTPPPTGNIALYKTASASSDYPTDGRYASTAVDGDTNTFWSSHMWTSSTDYQWLSVDLGSTVNNINRWVVRHYGGADDPKDFKLQKSSDGTNWTDVDSVTGNTADVTDRNVTSFSARYVRVYITVPQQSASQWARIKEFELYTSGGTATPTPNPTPTPSGAGTKYEAESGTLANGATVGNDSNASGGQCVQNMHLTNASCQINNVDGGSGGSKTLNIIYAANGTGTLSIYVNGALVASPSFPTTGGWSAFTGNLQQTITLNSGIGNTIKFVGGNGGINPDYIQVSGGPQNNSIYHLICQTSGKALDNAGSTTNGSAVTQWADGSGNSNQEWKAVDAGGGYFRLICQKSGKALDNGGTTTEGATATQWTEQPGNTNQNWRFVDAGGGYFRLICQTSGKVLDNSGSTTDGTTVKQWTEQPGNSNQNWRLVFIR